jgi:hypothetical protein
MLLNDKPINPGELRTCITLLKSAIVKVPGGQRVAWSAQAQVKARWVNAHGAEGVTGESLQATRLATVLIRAYAGLDASWGLLKSWDALVDGADIWQLVTPPDNIRERNEYMELTVKLVKGSL